MTQNVWLTPEQPMYVQGCKVIKILAIPTQEMIDKENRRLSDLGKAKRRPVKCLTNGKVFKSIKDASEGTGVNPGAISKICNGKQKTSSGFTFQFQ